MAITQPSYPVTTSALVTHVGSYVDAGDAALDTRVDALEAGSIPKTLVDAAGDLLVGSADNTVTRLAKGTEGQVLKMAAGAVTWGTDSTGGGSGALPTDNTDGQLLGSVGTTATWLDVDTAVSSADIPFTPTGTIAGTDLQTAVAEVATDGASALTTHAAVTTSVHGITDTSNLALKTVTVNAQTGTTYTLVLGDASELVTVSNASTHTLTVPTNASVAFATGTVINVARIGAGAVNLAAAGGVTINSPGSVLGLRAQYSQATLIKTATNTWLLGGDIA